MKAFSFETLDDLKAKIPTARLGQLELSRMMLGGNLMNGFAHARDLIYVSKLIKAYHHENKVFETLKLAEACGVNAIITNPILAPMITAYWDRGIGKIQFLAQCKGKDEKELLDVIHYSIDQGACAAYIQGAAADEYVKQGKFDWIARSLDVIRDSGLPAGIGGHYLQTIMACVDQGLKPDFWMKTLHHHNYWSAQRRRSARQHLVRAAGRNHRFHGAVAAALDRIQGPGRRIDPPQGRLPLRVRERRRFHLRRHVRLPGCGKRQPGLQSTRRQARASPRLVRLKAGCCARPACQDAHRRA